MEKHLYRLVEHQKGVSHPPRTCFKLFNRSFLQMCQCPSIWIHFPRCQILWLILPSIRSFALMRALPTLVRQEKLVISRERLYCSRLQRLIRLVFKKVASAEYNRVVNIYSFGGEKCITTTSQQFCKEVLYTTPETGLIETPNATNWSV